MKPKTTLNNFNKSFDIFFYPNGTLYLQISDLNFITPILNPLSTIETFYEIKGQTNVAFIIYLKVISTYGKPSKEFLIIAKVIKHKKLNRQSNQCEESENYNFAGCINEKLMLNVGCQPHWFYKPEINLTLCSNFSQLNAFVHNYAQILSLIPEDINDNLGCLKPCTYMEYKVNLTLVDRFILHDVINI